ncbi:Peptidase M1 membrane alanine aminopeptidase N-terminal [Trinorchestia longiramus]|nr:Peptidase M1 membrane alanine aminopeptidase N-terminal [Trinorchestia longiramus]
MLHRRRLPMHLEKFDEFEGLPLANQVMDMDDKNYGTSSSWSSARSSKSFVSKRTLIFLSVFLVVSSFEGLPLANQVMDMDDKNYGTSSSWSSARSSKSFVSKRTLIFLSVFLVVSSVCIALLVYYGQQENQDPWFVTDTYIRLPRSIHPISYELWLQPLIYGNLSIIGAVKIVMNVTIPTSNVTLHINDIITKNETVTIHAVDDLSGQGIKIKEQIYQYDKNFYIAKLETELQADRQYVFYMEYEGYLNDQLRGLYMSSYLRENGTLMWMAATQFQPTDARRAFPCFDEPALKATFQVHVARQTNMNAISNMPKINTTAFKEGWVWDHFNTSLPMSTYLLSIAVSDFDSVESNYNDHVTFRIWARHDAISQTWYANKIGPEILTYYEEYFSVPYPLPKQDMIAIPDLREHAMENWGLITYSRYGNAQQDDLWTALTDQGYADGTLREDLSVKTIMDTWTLQMGYPVVNVELTEDGEAVISQKRFLLVENPDSLDTHDYKWWVPITYTTQESPDFTQTIPFYWLSDNGESLVIKNISTTGWHFFNLQQTGYYRVNYGVDNWERLIHQLKEDLSVINLVSRAQLIDDAMDLARAGELNYSIPLNVNSYLSEEKEFVPWSAALNNLAYLEKMFTRTGGYAYLRNYLLKLLIPLYNDVGFEDNPNNSHDVQKKRVIAVTWACALEYEDCVSNATALYANWMANPTSTNISENLKPVVYCTAIARGSEQEWNFAWSQYSSSNVAHERKVLLKGMACSREIWILSSHYHHAPNTVITTMPPTQSLPPCPQHSHYHHAPNTVITTMPPHRLLEMAFTEGSGIRYQDASFTFNAVATNDVGRDLAWDYLRKNVQEIANYLKSKKKLKRLIRTVTLKFNDPLQREELQNFEEQYVKELDSFSFDAKESIELTSDNIAWMDTNYDTIVKWLRENGYETMS